MLFWMCFITVVFKPPVTKLCAFTSLVYASMRAGNMMEPERLNGPLRNVKSGRQSAGSRAYPNKEIEKCTSVASANKQPTCN